MRKVGEVKGFSATFLYFPLLQIPSPDAKSRGVVPVCQWFQLLLAEVRG